MTGKSKQTIKSNEHDNSDQLRTAIGMSGDLVSVNAELAGKIPTDLRAAKITYREQVLAQMGENPDNYQYNKLPPNINLGQRTEEHVIGENSWFESAHVYYLVKRRIIQDKHKELADVQLIPIYDAGLLRAGRAQDDAILNFFNGDNFYHHLSEFLEPNLLKPGHKIALLFRFNQIHFTCGMIKILKAERDNKRAELIYFDSQGTPISDEYASGIERVLNYHGFTLESEADFSEQEEHASRAESYKAGADQNNDGGTPRNKRIFFVPCPIQTEGHNCGIFAYLNLIDLLIYGLDNKTSYESRRQAFVLADDKVKNYRRNFNYTRSVIGQTLERLGGFKEVRLNAALQHVVKAMSTAYHLTLAIEAGNKFSDVASNSDQDKDANGHYNETQVFKNLIKQISEQIDSLFKDEDGKKHFEVDITHVRNDHYVLTDKAGNRKIITEINRDSNGDYTYKYQDGETKIMQAKGNIKIIYSDGAIKNIFSDGSTKVDKGDGFVWTFQPDGTCSVVYDSDYRKTFRADGTISISYKDTSGKEIGRDGTVVRLPRRTTKLDGDPLPDDYTYHENDNKAVEVIDNIERIPVPENTVFELMRPIETVEETLSISLKQQLFTQFHTIYSQLVEIFSEHTGKKYIHLSDKEREKLEGDDKEHCVLLDTLRGLLNKWKEDLEPKITSDEVPPFIGQKKMVVPFRERDAGYAGIAAYTLGSMVAIVGYLLFLNLTLPLSSIVAMTTLAAFLTGITSYILARNDLLPRTMAGLTSSAALLLMAFASIKAFSLVIPAPLLLLGVSFASTVCALFGRLIDVPFDIGEKKSNDSAQGVSADFDASTLNGLPRQNTFTFSSNAQSNGHNGFDSSSDLPEPGSDSGNTQSGNAPRIRMS